MYSKHNVSLAVSAAFLSKAKAGKCPFGFDTEAEPTNVTTQKAHPRVRSTPDYPSDIFTCDATGDNVAIATTASSAMTKANYQSIVSAVIDKYESVADTVADNNNPRAKFAGCIVRTVGHDFMDFRVTNGVESGGSDGCMAFSDADNTGLPTCLEDSGLADTFQDYCDETSLADFLVIAGEAVMGRTSPTYNSDDYYGEATLANLFLENFEFGRTTQTTCTESDGLMPNPENGCDGLESIFVDHIYASETGNEWMLTAAISGAHTLGSATIANSGYDGFWADSTQSGIFNNDYYKGIIHKGWGVERAVNGNTNKNQWKRIDLRADELTHKEMMLSTDLCLAMVGDPGRGGGGGGNGGGGRRNNGRGQNNDGDSDDDGDGGGGNGPSDEAEPLLAQTHNCCAWIEVENLDLQKGDAFCGGILNGNGRGRQPQTGTIWNWWDPENRRECCDTEDDDSFGDCDNTNRGNGPAYAAVKRFSESEAAFINGYARAWQVATTNGFSSLTAIGSGNGIRQFNTAFEALKVEQSCDYGIFGCEATFGQCASNWWQAKRFCWSDGDNGSYRYEFDQ